MLFQSLICGTQSLITTKSCKSIKHHTTSLQWLQCKDAIRIEFCAKLYPRLTFIEDRNEDAHAKLEIFDLTDKSC